ncbi:hypothetical protein [Acidipila sp. EB88]|uniref:hypothetical protein n=1 Tax=Acidipila sp. EB88 TaxID=2305226 RepID=UPI000F5FDDC4|nr:hypothetical protein [Acidipila sp. EB88]RRA47297.1 hypothetical protein D1Y84_02300 [Acidipila sp. EB88]
MSNSGASHLGISADCAAFQERLPQLFSAEGDFSKEPHLESCENCAELVRDLEYIAQQAKLLMPIHDPSPAVWDNIKSALGSPETSRK